MLNVRMAKHSLVAGFPEGMGLNPISSFTVDQRLTSEYGLEDSKFNSKD